MRDALMLPDDGVVDEIAVARACDGHQVPLTRAERREAVLTLRGRGCGTREIMRRLQMASATVKELLDQSAGEVS